MNIPEYDTWLFDLDGTLVDSLPAVVECMKKTAKEVGGEVMDEELLKASFGRGLESSLGPWVPSARFNEAMEKYMMNFPSVVKEQVRLFEGVIDLLELLSSRAKILGVVTGNRRSEAEWLFERLSLNKYFDQEGVIYADSIPFRKPSPEPVLEALKRLRANVETAVFVGDSEHDIRAGNLAGVQTIAIKGGSSLEERLNEAAPSFIVNNVTEVLNYMN